MHIPAAWLDLLDGVDAVVNVAGILREENGQTFQCIHIDAPLALAQACVQIGVRRFVQISALGNPADGAFIASKHQFDEALLALPLDAVVLRPSLVYSAAGSYGGTSLLRAIAGFPGFQWLPGHADWPVQPLAAEDLGALVAAAAANRAVGIYEVGGPARMPLHAYQTQWRHWLRIAGTRAIRVPEALISLQVWLWERIGSGPVGETMWRMLRRGNVTANDAHAHLARDFGIAPRPLKQIWPARRAKPRTDGRRNCIFSRQRCVCAWRLCGCYRRGPGGEHPLRTSKCLSTVRRCNRHSR